MSRIAADRPTQERNTRQKRAIREVFEHANRPLSIEEVLEEVQRSIVGIGIATVYRAVRSFIEDGTLEAVDVPGRPPLYERAGKEHHHHFVCETCTRVFELQGCSSDVKPSLPRGFRATGHDLTIYGVCNHCPRSARSPQTA